MATDIGPRIGITGEKAFQDSIKAVNAQLKSLDAQMQSVTAEFAKNADSEDALAAKNQVLEKSVDAAKQKLSLLDKQLASQKEKLVALGDALEKAEREFGANSAEAIKAQNAYNKQYRAVADLEQQYSKTTAKINEMTNAMEGAGDEAGKASTSLGAGDILAASAAWDGIKMAVNGVNNAIQECIQTGMEFSASVSGVAATMGTTAEEVDNLRDFAKDMGATTAFTATEAAEALNYMALAGYSAEESMQALPNVLNLAAAGGVALAQASDMITDAQSALGLSMEQSARMVDEMAMASTKSNTSVAQLGEAMLTVGGTAKYMAGGTAEISQVLGVLADSSIKGAEGGTKLRNILLSLTTPTKDAAAELDRLGVSIFDDEDKLRSFSEIFPELNAAMSQLTDQQQLDALAKIFNSRDIAAAQALLGTTVERWNELDTAIQGAAGSAERMAKTKLDNLAGDLTLLKSAADGAKIAFSEALEPAMRNAAKAATAVISALGDFIEQNPIVAHAITGVTTALGVLAAGITVYTIKTKLAAAETKLFSAALSSTPLGAIAALAGVAATAFVGFTSAAEEAKSANDELLEGIREHTKAYQDSRSELDDQQESLSGMISTIEDLASVENKTAAQKDTLLSAIDELNNAVPELNLAYDEQTDSLNMTTEALKELALAEHERAVNAGIVERLKQAYIDHEEAVNALATAESNAKDAQKKWNAAVAEMENLDAGASAYDAEQKVSEAAKAMYDAQEDAENLHKTVARLSLEIGALNLQYDANIAASEGASNAAEGVGESAEETAEYISELTDRVKTLAEESAELTDANDLLKSSLDEQAESGSVSLDTALKLIDAGYAAALSIDEETGAVTLNKDAYIQLATAKINAKIATLEAEQQSILASGTYAREAENIGHVSNEYWNLSAAQLAAKAAGEDNLASLDAQIAALNRAKNSLGQFTTSVGGASRSAARSSSAASKKVKTQAEKDLETYKTLLKELDHQRSMDEISEAEYYRRLQTLRDNYLKDESNIEEYRKVNEKIYKIQSEYYEKAAELEQKYQDELADSAQNIMDTYSLFDEVPESQEVVGEQLIGNLRDQVESIRGFYENLNELEARGVDAGIVEEIRDMGPEASDQLEALLRLTDDQLSLYSDLYREKQKAANDAAVEGLKDLRKETDAQILENMESLQLLLDQNAPELGESFAENLAAGIENNKQLVTSAAINMAQSAVDAAQRILAGSGIGGISANVESPKSVKINRDVEVMMTNSNAGITRQELGNMMSGMVNAMQTASQNSGPQSLTVKAVLGTGLEVARAFLPNIRTASKESPEVTNDK